MSGVSVSAVSISDVGETYMSPAAGPAEMNSLLYMLVGVALGVSLTLIAVLAMRRRKNREEREEEP